ncbi:MAG: CDP-glycerol glycerophosphotransferase family protein [Hominenteromicrobium sp.]
MIFKDDQENRRFPAEICSYYPEDDLQHSVIFANARIRLPYLFTRPLTDAPVHIRIELIYGEETVYPLPLRISSDAKPEAEGYRVEFRPEKKEIVFQPAKRGKFHESQAEQIGTARKVFRGLLRWIHHLLLAVLSLALLPWFLFDALLSLFHVAAAAPTVKDGQRAGLRFLMQLKYSYQGLWHVKLGRSMIMRGLNMLYRCICVFCPVRKNRIAFLSSRRSDLTGNPEFVYEELKKDPSLEFRFLMKADAHFHMRPANILRFLYLYATSSVVLVDDFFQLLNYVDKRRGVRLIQLWHACGAFKTFGFSRIGKAGGPKQDSVNHRQYDYAIVSSKEIAKFYAEGFGLPQSHIAATGVPRTDIFMRADYAAQVKKTLYAKYPILKEKKVLLFAPTFRGNGQKTAYYPLNRFHPEEIVKATGGEYAVILKLHPFCRERFEIPQEYAHQILDFSNESELNDLLFITDLLVTDYSSAVFEASLLNIPMLLYAYDLREYIAQRDFYYEYESFVPGKIVVTEEELIEAIRQEDFETGKIEPFCRRFFDERDGRSTERVAGLIRSLLSK